LYYFSCYFSSSKVTGESIVVCTKEQLAPVKRLIQHKAVFARRCAVKRRRIKLIVEAICSALCSAQDELENLLRMLFFGCDTPLEDLLNKLIAAKLISSQKGCSAGELRGTQLGQAVFASSLPADIALQVYADLEKAMHSLALDTELH
uniref:DSHCT domain-containing protein n=1 Tax=Gongylonema pulchrum TaxID=637853 RepID=A0A183DM48_9BILA